MPTVTVACKLPNGIILHLDELVEHDVPVLGGGYRTEKRAQRVGQTVKINGNRAPYGKLPKGPIVGTEEQTPELGYALTHGVDAEFWAKWVEQNKKSDIFINKLIFAYEKQDAVEGKAKSYAKQRSGLEPVVPDGDPRIPKGSLSVQPAER
jgi:hypothetical protein